MPVMPPQGYPPAMQTPYVSPTPVYNMGGVSPTFLPENGENVWHRLGKNMLQGAFNSFGWHAFDYSRSVDMFRPR